MERMWCFSIVLLSAAFATGNPVNKNILISREQVVFQLYTRENPVDGSRIIIGNISTLENTGFDASHPTKILVHGWMDNIRSGLIQMNRREFLNLEPMNIIGVAWSDCSKTVLYEQAVECAKNVGGYIGELILWLGDVKGVSPSNVHGIGHSLGGEAISFTSRVVRIGRITALDPAKPLFTHAGVENRIDPSDADFVDVFHTSTSILGIKIAVGHVDFYPNGGVKQPDCENDIFGACAHGTAYSFYAYTIAEANRNAYVGYECNTIEDAVNQTCNAGKTAVMGYGASPDTRGIYYLDIPVVPFRSTNHLH